MLRAITNLDPPSSPARTREAARRRLRVGAVQHRWHPDPEEHRAALADGVRLAVEHGAALVCMQELTLYPYFPQSPGGAAAAGIEPEELPGGPTWELASALAAETGAHIHASLYERSEETDGRGYNTAIVVSPQGDLVARTRKLHIPVTAGYHEDLYFRAGPVSPEAYPVVRIEGAGLGFPTCWDQWFPELARIYSLEGADVLVYPTAIGSEPDHPDFDTEPLWEQVMIGNGIANGLFIVAVNRVGREGDLAFYGSSFISDPYGRKLVQAPREEPAVLVAELDLPQREDWLALFPFMATRRPELYAALADPGYAGKGETT